MPAIANYRGIIPAIFCPFTPDHRIDEPALRKLASWLAGHDGVVAIMTNGHTGEVFSLTPTERAEVTRIVADELKGRCPVISSIVCEGLVEAAEHARLAKAAGAAALDVMPPRHWLRFGFTPGHALQYFDAIHQAAADLDLVCHVGAGRRDRPRHGRPGRAGCAGACRRCVARRPAGPTGPGGRRADVAAHVGAATRLADALVPGMAARGSGRVVFVGSRVAQGMPGRGQYAATKAALVALARSWAAEVAAHGVTVNVVSPAATATAMLQDPSRAASAPRLPPIGRLIAPAEIADLVGYLLSPIAAAITGQDIAVCGGSSLPR